MESRLRKRLAPLPALMFMCRWLQLPLIMVIIGGYETFISRLGLDGYPNEPQWLSHVNPATTEA